MKQLIIILATILLLSCSFVCSSSDNSKNKENAVEEEIRLLESITYNGGKIIRYEYDSLNRLIKYPGEGKYMNKLIYNDNELVVVTYFNVHGSSNPVEFERNGNVITIQGYDWGNRKKYTYYLGNDGELIKEVHSTYTNNYKYDQNFNIIEKVDGLFRETKKYEYDDKKSPFIHCNTPKWWLQAKGFSNKNNIISDEYIYEYDSAGYPIKRIRQWETEERDIAEQKFKENIADWERDEYKGYLGPIHPFAHDTAVYKYIYLKGKDFADEMEKTAKEEKGLYNTSEDKEGETKAWRENLRKTRDVLDKWDKDKVIEVYYDWSLIKLKRDLKTIINKDKNKENKEEIARIDNLFELESLQESLFSAEIQYGRLMGVNLFKETYKIGISSEEWLENIYKKRGEDYNEYIERYTSELEDVKKILSKKRERNNF
jgi:hypothetical protein